MEDFLIFWIFGFFSCNILGFLFTRFLFAWFMLEAATVRQLILVFLASLIPMVNIAATFFLVAFSLVGASAIFWGAFERRFKKTLDRPLSTLFKRNSK